MSASVLLCSHGRGEQREGAPAESRGLPPRASPGDYQTQAQAGALTIAAEFKGHVVPTPQGNLTTEEFVVVEAALFGPPGAHASLSTAGFSLRINGRKAALPSQPYAVVFASLKDPEWEPPASSGSKSKTSLSGGGSGARGDDNAPPAPVKIPVEVQRAMAQRVQKAALPEGDRALPVAGLLFFPYRGKAQSIRTVELIYAGPSGDVTLPLRP